MRLLTSRPGLLALALATGGLVAGGCGGERASQREIVREQVAPLTAAAFPSGQPLATADVETPERLGGQLVPTGAPPAECSEAGEQRLGGTRRAYAAIAERRTVAYRRPGRGPIETFARFNVNRYPTVFGVLGVVRGADCEPRWYRVQLPIRPNGSVGYVRAADVELARVRARIEVDLSERRLELYRDGKLVERLTTAVGAPSTPTPTGRFYVNQRLLPGDPSGPWGPAALGISAFSPVLVYWPQGGPIAIHGTNNPSSIGQAASNGCLRLANDDLRRVWKQAPAGTPVVIQA